MQIQCSPFGEISKAELISALANSGLGLTAQSTPEQIYAAIESLFPQIFTLYNKGIYAQGYGVLNGKTHNSNCTANGFSLSAIDDYKIRCTAYAFINQPINLTPYKKLNASITFSGEIKGSYGASVGINSSPAATMSNSATITTNGVASLDISNITGFHYVGALAFGGNGSATGRCTATISNLELVGYNDI